MPIRSIRSPGTGVQASAPALRVLSARSPGCCAASHAAGPNLTPQTFKQGLFSYPPTGGALEDRPGVAHYEYANVLELWLAEHSFVKLNSPSRCARRAFWKC